MSVSPWLMDIVAPVREKAKTFEEKLAARRRRGGAATSAAPSPSDEGEITESVRAAAVLTALEWIEHVLSTVDWGRVRHDKVGPEKRCSPRHKIPHHSISERAQCGATRRARHTLLGTS
jgi:hypothetical protein